MSHRQTDTAESLAEAVRKLHANAAGAFREGLRWGTIFGAVLGATITGAVLV